jgi:rSAM/selenodomain-associated transferase 1
MSAAVVVFMKAPDPGRCKTRLCPPLSAVQAAGLYRAFCADVMEVARTVGPPVWIAYDGSEGFPTPAWAAEDAPFFRQAGCGLGDRLVHAFDRIFAMGFSRAVVVGSDSPAMPRERLAEAFELLRTREAVFGPAEDGGYYLVGLAGPLPALFRGIPWSTDAVMAATEAAAAREGLTTALLPRHRDVDTPEDLLDLAERLGRGPKELAPATRSALAGLDGRWTQREARLDEAR